MPSRNNPLRICVIGDSQMGSLKKATDAGLVCWPELAEIEYWGATGPRFRDFFWEDGAMHASDLAKSSVQQINKAGRDHIAAEDFDCVLFYGARLRPYVFLAKMLDWRDRMGAWPSKQVLDESARKFLISSRAFRFASEFASHGAKSIFAASPFPTQGVVDHHEEGRLFDYHPVAEKATEQQRAFLTNQLQTTAAEFGVSLVLQPAATVCDGLLTKEEFAQDGAHAAEDFGHKSPEFAALMIEQVIPLLPLTERAA